ncbi:MAG TPA: hypothetical protein VM818_07210 [Vicinamibacterales bacterium]|nr:hypothetical protein [Vicinamibacterales bacterium]
MTKVAVLSLVASALSCTSKSSNPLSPVVAGPIEGVGITAPSVMQPGVDAMIDTTSQPIVLKVGNAATNGVRPLSVRFEVATDPGFTNQVFARVVPQDGSGQTSVQLPNALAPERKYFWHARAEDGANAGPFGATSAFSIFTPVVFGPPILLAPINNVLTTSQQPRFVIGNAPRTGPAGFVAYYLEISNSKAQVVAGYQFPETPGQTELVAPTSLPAGQYFWIARAYDPGFAGPFSVVQSFVTPPSPGSGGGGGGGVGNPSGRWEDCGSTPGYAVVLCVYQAINPAKTEAGIFEMTKRVAWLLRGSGFGLLRKDGGDNITTWNGISFAVARIVLPDGHLYKLLSDVPNGNPQWVDEGIEPHLASLWIAPMQP